MQIPTQAGQICQILNPVEDENPSDVYIVAEDPIPFNLDEDIYIVNLRDLQRNIDDPSGASQIPVQKSELKVIADSLEAYIKSWNN